MGIDLDGDLDVSLGRAMLDCVGQSLSDGGDKRGLIDLLDAMKRRKCSQRAAYGLRVTWIGGNADVERGSLGHVGGILPQREGRETHAVQESAMPNTAPTPDEVKTYTERAGESQVRIATDKGDIVFTFFPEDAPVHTTAFMKLAEEGFYDGLAFHRVEPGFVVQGGDPDGDGTGGPGYRLKAEFNARPHVRGTVAMARSSNPDSAGSQFYICLGDARFLDNNYTVFGQMTEGFEALDAIKRGDKMNLVTVEPSKG
jgi:peptidyl-prolyl cis-trans isomerase B (cyclophilin B)